jgi:hypothetical protein
MKRTLLFLPRLLLWLIIAGVTLELCARIDDRLSFGAPFVGIYDNSSLQYFDQFGPRGKPNAHYQKWQLNSLGYRAEELREGSFRILCLGASETFGQYESAGKEWPVLLQSKLRAAGYPRTQIINAAFSGESLPVTLQRLEEHLAHTRPHLVIVYGSPTAYLHLPFLPKKITPPKPPAFAPRLKRRVETLLRTSLPPLVMDQLRAFELKRAEREHPAPWKEAPLELRERWSADLQQIAHRVAVKKIPLAFVSHPHRFGRAVTEEEQGMLTAWRRFYPMIRREALLPFEDEMNDRLRRVAAANNSTVIEAARQMPVGPRYFFDFVHFTDEGSDVFTDIAMKHLVAAGYLER